MELNLSKQMVAINEVIYDGSVEQPIECDALLPDYCPDIVKILKCSVTPAVSSNTVMGDKLTIDGMATAKIYYTSDTPCIRQVEYKIPFSKVVDMRPSTGSPIVTVSVNLDYVNCRAVNQRRVDVRGAISLGVKAMSQKQEEIISGCEGGGVQLRRGMAHATELVTQCHSPVSVEEELEIPYGKSSVGAVLRAGCQANVLDFKVIAGKVVVKGDLMLHVLYQSKEDENQLECADFSLPLSQIVDCDGVDENSVCMVELCVVSCDVLPKTDGDGEYRCLSLEARLEAMVKVHRHVDVPIAGDCYSTLYECKGHNRPVSFMKLMDVVHESIPHKMSLDLPEGVEKVVDAWCQPDSTGWKMEESSIKVEMKFSVCMFARMEDGETMYFEQPATFESNLPAAKAAGMVFEPTANILSTAFTPMGKEKLDIRCDVLLGGCLYSTFKKEALSSIEVDEETPKHKDYNKLYIYYSDPGESVWDIAKRYNTSQSAIWEENSLEDDKLGDKRMLLIPII